MSYKCVIKKKKQTIKQKAKQKAKPVWQFWPNLLSEVFFVSYCRSDRERTLFRVGGDDDGDGDDQRVMKMKMSLRLSKQRTEAAFISSTWSHLTWQCSAPQCQKVMSHFCLWRQRSFDEGLWLDKKDKSVDFVWIQQQINQLTTDEKFVDIVRVFGACLDEEGTDAVGVLFGV